jgi:hypothetical protein
MKSSMPFMFRRFPNMLAGSQRSTCQGRQQEPVGFFKYLSSAGFT